MAQCYDYRSVSQIQKQKYQSYARNRGFLPRQGKNISPITKTMNRFQFGIKLNYLCCSTHPTFAFANQYYPIPLFAFQVFSMLSMTKEALGTHP